jgi:hypothetical protein
VRQTGYTPNLFLRDMFLKRREVVGVGGAPGPEAVSVVATPTLSAADTRTRTRALIWTQR